MRDKIYVAIDLKSFYASVECVERNLDPLTTNLVVADVSRTEKTICLAVSPSLKAYGISGRSRLFEVVQRVREVNADRKINAPKHTFTGSSNNKYELEKDPSLQLSYIAAVPRMAKYMEYSTKIYGIYLNYIAPEDIHVYSIDEVFIDVTGYLDTYKMTARQLAMTMIHEVLETTGIIATAGIGTNLYLCKVAMDVVAKKISPDKDGVRIAELDEMSYRELLWNHTPITDFWRVGRGYAKKLYSKGLYTMGDVAKCSVGDPHDYFNEELLYKLFGINAQLLIDHAWGWEPCTMKDIKSYKPLSNSLSTGQVLTCPYDFDKAKLIVMEMSDLLSLDLAEKGFVTKQLVLTVCYDVESLNNTDIYCGEVTTDFYGRSVPKSAHGTENLPQLTFSSKLLNEAFVRLFCRIVDKNLLVRRLYLVACNIVDEKKADGGKDEQLDMFTDYDEVQKKRDEEKRILDNEKRIQGAIIRIKQRYGKNAIIKGMNLEEGGTTISRNSQIGGHRA